MYLNNIWDCVMIDYGQVSLCNFDRGKLPETPVISI